MGRIIQFLKDWMLPVAIAAGILICLAMNCIGWLDANVEPGFTGVVKDLQPVLVALMLFLQFNKISPTDLRLKRWHLWLLLFQTIIFVSLALATTMIPVSNPRILIECAMLCFVCPTAAAAGVITDKLGGSLSETVTYVVLINILAAIVIPLVIPIVHPSGDSTFFVRFAAICMRVFPLLVFPLLIAWFIRYTMKRLHEKLVKYAGWAFYVWGVTLCLSIYLATGALLKSGVSFLMFLMICLVSIICTFIQFKFGRWTGRRINKDPITAGQALGQKNTGFLIWLGYSWMTPVTSVAGGLYSIWQNLFNALELYNQRHHKG
ncbi:MAG: transporter [Bacteroidales bacterium]|nr:transporter [Bacteroidales bacterium]